MGGLVACVRKNKDKVKLRFKVFPKQLKMLETVGCAGGWDCECPVTDIIAAKGAGWLKGWVTPNGWVEETRI